IESAACPRPSAFPCAALSSRAKSESPVPRLAGPPCELCVLWRLSFASRQPSVPSLDLLFLRRLLVFPFLGRRFLCRCFLRPGVFLFVRGFFGFRRGLVGLVAVRGFLSTIICHLPTRALELNRRRSNYLVDFAAAV